MCSLSCAILSPTAPAWQTARWTWRFCSTSCTTKNLKEAFRILNSDGIAAVIHWNYDPNTPRGPALEIRPRLEQFAWAEQDGFTFQPADRIDLKPYHYGLRLRKPALKP